MQPLPIPAGLAKIALLQDREGEMASRLTEKQDGQALRLRVSEHSRPSEWLRADLFFCARILRISRVSTCQALAAIAASAHAALSAPRPRGKALITLRDVKIGAVGANKVTIVEAVNDNMPFLLDSRRRVCRTRSDAAACRASDFERRSRRVRRFVALRGEARGQRQAGERRESFIHLHVDPIEDAALRGRLLEGLDRVHADVRRAVSDFPTMRARVFEAIQAAKIAPPPLAARDVAEAIALIEWMLADNFTFLGVREYRFVDDDPNADLVGVNGLGLLRDPDLKVLRQGREFLNVTPEVRAFLAEPTPLIVTKANIKSRVHRRVHMDYVGLKLFSPEGQPQGELRIVGLFTANAYDSPVAAVPYLRRKAEAVLSNAALDPASYMGRALKNVLETYPRDELFQIDVETLNAFASDILTLSERPRIRALARRDRFNRFVSILVYVPKDRYISSSVRKSGCFSHEPMLAACRRPIRPIPMAPLRGPISLSAEMLARRRTFRARRSRPASLTLSATGSTNCAAPQPALHPIPASLL